MIEVIFLQTKYSASKKKFQLIVMNTININELVYQDIYTNSTLNYA